MKRPIAWMLLLCLLITPWSALAAQKPSPEKSRLPGPVEMDGEARERILKNGSIQRSKALDVAFSLLEEGNPFLERYNLITGAKIKPRLPYGVPYLFGGQAANHVFAKAPDYVVQQAWQNSKNYYRAGTTYIYGFDCVGFAKWAWKQTYKTDMQSIDTLLRDRKKQIWNSASKPMPDWPDMQDTLQPGDLLVLKHPGTHVAFYVGTLRMYGYTEEEAPGLADWMDWPLVIHSSTNAAVSDHFAYLIKHGLRKYRIATVTDGGVAVSLLCASNAIAPYKVNQQNQNTCYFVLPDNSWLTLLPWKNVVQF